MTAKVFEELQSVLDSGGVDAVLDRLVDQLRAKKKFHELFEALKMRLRRRLGLPLAFQDDGDQFDAQQRQELEDGLIDACREVGMALLADGRIHDGWMYMRPVGDKAAVAAALADMEVNEDNIDEYVDVALNEGVAPESGFSAVLNHYGTCNAITTYETVLAGRGRADQEAAANLLVRHLHEELKATLAADVARQEGSEPGETTIKGLVEQRDWLFSEEGYHIDTTHLASTVRFARVLEDEDTLRLALDLTEYGRRLSSSFQYEGEEPFADIYPSHAMFFRVLLGEDVEASLAFFRERAESVSVEEHGTAAAEVYVALLARLDRYEEAIDAAIRLIPPGTYTHGYAPSLLDLSQQAGSFSRLIELCQQRDDLLGFATGLVHAKLSEPRAQRP